MDRKIDTTDEDTLPIVSKDSTVNKDSNNQLFSMMVELKNYSNAVAVLNKENKYIETGTGFFIRQNQRLFFITCKHVAWAKGANSLKVFFVNGGNYIIQLNQYPKDSFNESSSPRGDIAVFEVKYNLDIPEISTYIDDSYFDKKPNKYLVWGYTTSQPIVSNKVELNLTYNIGGEINTDSMLEKVIVFNGLKDDLVREKKYIKETDIIIPIYLQFGLSGSPVFGIFDTTKAIKFIGILYGGDKISKVSFGNKAKILLDTLYSHNKLRQ